MTDKITESEDIKDTDIIFDCPHCGKSLAIDYRGAGLTIPCSDCGMEVQVPIPEGMELTDIDSTEEEQEIRILHLRNSLTAAESRIATLESELEEINERRKYLEASQTRNMRCFKTIKEKTEIIREALAQIAEAIKEIDSRESPDES